jgi:hypothetical protein
VAGQRKAVVEIISLEEGTLAEKSRQRRKTVRIHQKGKKKWAE